jgi:predicted dinucleotide-binding enzyme
MGPQPRSGRIMALPFSVFHPLPSAHAFMVNSSFPDEKPTMFFCGNNDEARTEMRTILEKFGHEPEDMGKTEAVRAIEPLCMLWRIPGFIRNQWTHSLS